MNASSSVDPQRKWTDATIRYYKLIYRRHISRLLSPGGRRVGVTEAFNLSLSADGYTTPARPALPIPIPNVIYVNGNETETEKFDTETVINLATSVFISVVFPFHATTQVLCRLT